jgi:hypothetical protein
MAVRIDEGYADELAEALRNSRTYALEEWNAMVEMSGKKKS